MRENGYLSNISEKASENLRSVGYSSNAKPNVFVAMPFEEKMEDIYHYGINGAVKKAGILCERADHSYFTGDIMEWIKDRIEKSSLVIADLTTSNANVYLEVGYAWGHNKDTILLVQNIDELKFDVKGQKCLEYRNIKDLEEKLSKLLGAFSNNSNLST